jgi:histidine ammonia-lyase
LLVKWAYAIGAMTLESILGASRSFDKIVFNDYHHKGAKISASFIRNKMIAESGLINRSADVHDPYSVRCIPQVHGAVRDALKYVERTLKHQLNSVDDDPIFFTEEEMNREEDQPIDVKLPPLGTSEDWKKRRHFEQGSFHGEPIAFAMDMLAIIVAELGSISERRIQMLLDKNHNRGLPACLIDNPEGTNSGYMIAQYTAAALVSENKGLCHPASVDSIPTSANTEDHVSMSTIAARKARKVIENVSNVLAIELLCATEAISFRLGDQKITIPKTAHLEKADRERKKLKVDRNGQCGTGTLALYNTVRGLKEHSLLGEKDAVLSPMIEKARDLLKDDLAL